MKRFQVVFCLQVIANRSFLFEVVSQIILYLKILDIPIACYDTITFISAISDVYKRIK